MTLKKKEIEERRKKNRREKKKSMSQKFLRAKCVVLFFLFTRALSSLKHYAIFASLLSSSLAAISLRSDMGGRASRKTPSGLIPQSIKISHIFFSSSTIFGSFSFCFTLCYFTSFFSLLMA